jgi:integrase
MNASEGKPMPPETGTPSGGIYTSPNARGNTSLKKLFEERSEPTGIQTPRDIPSPSSSSHAGIDTLTDVEKRELIERPVMCSITDSTGSVQRSLDLADAGIADGMTDNEAAQRPMLAGVTCALSVSASHPQDVTCSDHRIAASAIETNGKTSTAAMPTASSAKSDARLEAGLESIIANVPRLLKSIERDRQKRGDTQASIETKLQYAKHCKRVDDWHDPNTDLSERVAHFAPKANTFNLVKAALKSRAIEFMYAALKAQADFLESGNMKDRLDVAQQLKCAVEDYITLRKLDREAALKISGAKKLNAKSKLADVRHLPSDWRKQFLDLNEQSPTYRVTGVLMCFTGVRPEELARGIRVQDDGTSFRVTVNGAKVRANHGQETRSFCVRKAVMPKWLIAELTTNPQPVYSAEKGAMRKHLSRISAMIKDKVPMPGGKQPIVSAYCFRHALVTDLRDAGWSDAEIAPVIGDRSASTVHNHYGERAQTGKTRKKVSAVMKETVTATHAVKPLRSDANTFAAFQKTRSLQAKSKNRSITKNLSANKG